MQLRSRVRDWLRSIVEPGPGTYDAATLRLVSNERTVAIAALSVGALVFGDFGLAVPATVLVVGTAANLVFRRRTRTAGGVTEWLHVVDMLGCLVLPVVEPRTLLPAVLVMMAVVALTAVMAGAAPAVAVTLLGVVGLALVELAVDLTDAAVVVVAFGLAGAMVALTVGRLAAAEARVRRDLDLASDRDGAGRWVRCVRSGAFTEVDERALAVAGWSRSAWLAPGFWERHVHPEDRAGAEAAFARAVEGAVEEVAYRFRAADGRWLHLHDRISPLTDATGRTTAVQGTSLDVTELVQIERQVDQYVDIIDRIDLALLVLRLDEDDERLRLVASNPAAGRLLADDLEPRVGEPVHRAIPTLDDGDLWDRVADVVRSDVPTTLAEVPLDLGEGDRRTVTVRAFPLPERSVGVSLQDVTDAVAASEALRRQALQDGLTGLANRRMLDDRLQRTIRAAAAQQRSVALLVMDLDQFKEVNDALGHHVGDQVLRGIGRRLGRLDDAALVARLGGDEFAVILTDVCEAAALATADRIREALAEPFVVDGIRLQSNVSVGVALFPDHATDVPTLVQRADVAMYHAKNTGTGVSVYAAEHDRSSVERLSLIGDLPEAVSSGQLTLHFQPVLDLRRGAVVRVEALVRWNHPRLGLLGHDQFVELAELSGAIRSLTRWVLDEALAAARRWTDEGHELGVAVNLSVRNLHDPELVTHFAAALARHGVPPGDLVLELTESEIMDDPGLAREVFEGLGRLGVATAIDDFGTGYSSLTYLRDLPLREIKIDRSFVQAMRGRGDEYAIVRSMVELGHNLGLEVVAEGVEHELDMALLRDLDCDMAQGFYVGPPLPLDELLTLLAATDVDATEPVAADAIAAALPPSG